MKPKNMLTAMTMGRGLAAAAALGCLLAVGSLGMLASAATAGPGDAAAPAGDDRPVIDIEHKGPIKVVFQITTADMKEGVSKGLFYVNKLHNAYVAAGVDPDQLDIRAVFHGDGAAHLLTNEAWNRVKNESTGNPSADLIAKMTKNGVHVELCDGRRAENGWAKSDVHPDVLLVKGAFLRVIDLQQSGYAYIRL